jgi:Fe-S-cluster containining protein
MTVSLPKEAVCFGEMLPILYAIDGVLVETLSQSAQENGQNIACRKGCGACCRQLVAISLVEAQELAQRVAALPAKRQARIRARFDQAVQRLEEAGLLDPNESSGERALTIEDHGSRETSLHELSRKYFRQQIPCPFLEEESCSIHDARPMVCREYHVTSPAERCGHLFDQAVDRLEPPLRLGDVLTRAGEKILGLPPYSVPLVLALEWAGVHGGMLDERRNAAEMFEAVMVEAAHSPEIAIRWRALGE